jgi:hypothetical protein
MLAHSGTSDLFHVAGVVPLGSQLASAPVCPGHDGGRDPVGASAGDGPLSPDIPGP